MPRLTSKQLRERYGKRPDSRINATPRAVAVTHAGKSALRSARLDRRTREARFEERLIATRIAHCGGEDVVTEPLLAVIRHSARLELLAALAWAEVRRTGPLTEAGEPSAAVATFLGVGRELREALKVIGLERREKPTPTLDDYLQGRAELPGEPAEAPA